MSKRNEPVVLNQSPTSDGGLRLEVNFFAGRSLPQKLDPKFARTFILDAKALEVLELANSQISEGLAQMMGGRSPTGTFAPFNPSMAVYLYTRKHKAESLPNSEIMISATELVELLNNLNKKRR